MKVHKAYRYEIKPNIEEKIRCAKHAGAARFTYNWGLMQRIDFYEKDKTTTVVKKRALKTKESQLLNLQGNIVKSETHVWTSSTNSLPNWQKPSQ